MFNESELKAIYQRNPFLMGYVSTMLEDLQLSENDEAFLAGREARDSGTIYTLPGETFGRALADCEAFRRVANRDGALDEAEALHDYCAERAGSDFHMTRVGHGTGFWDNLQFRPANRSDGGDTDLGEPLTEAAHLFRNEGGYFGDDGRVYL